MLGVVGGKAGGGTGAEERGGEVGRGEAGVADGDGEREEGWERSVTEKVL